MLDSPLTFVGPNVYSASAQVDCRPLAILNFHLPSLGVQSPAAITVHAALSPFFLPTPIFDISANLATDAMDTDSEQLAKMRDGPIIPDVDPSLYMYRDIPFNFGTAAEMRRHKENLAQLVSDLTQ